VVVNWLTGRFAPVRLLAIPAGVGCLLIYQGPRPSTVEWLAVFAGVALSLAGGALPLTVAISQAGMLLAVEGFTDARAIPIKWMASIALFEVAIRRWGVPTALSSAALSTAYLAKSGAELTGDTAALLFKITAVVGVPVVLGGYIRSVQRNAEQARTGAELQVAGARLAERTAIARELHDIVAHHLSSMALRIGVARHVVADADPRVREVLDDVHANASTALGDLRRLVTALREQPALLVDAAELPDALTAMIARVRLNVTASIDPAVSTVDAVRALTILRVAQEGLTNAAKHGGAQAKLTVSVTGGDAHVEITNDVPGSSTPGSGMGLVGMRERVALAGGTLEVGPAGGGWRLSALLPEPA